jgi:GNAT superfamily N-acetyltransferase
MNRPPAAVDLFHTLELRTDIGVLYDDARCTVRDGFVAVENPQNPLHFGGNMLVFPGPPRHGDLERWLALWDETFGDRFDHRTFEWDTAGGEEGASAEFVDAGFDLHRTSILAASPGDIRPPEKDTSHVEVVEVDLAAAGDDVVALGLASDPAMAAREGVERHREYQRKQLARRQRAIEAGRGFWLGARAGDGTLTGALGLFDVGGGIARYQHVDTHPDWRRQGICSRLLYGAAQRGAERLDVDTLVIAADREYHALDLYRKAGFAERELSAGLCRVPAPPAES